MGKIDRCTIVGSLILCVGWLYGARPFATDDAGTVEQSIHELEFGVDFWSEEAALELSFKHGLTDRLDLGLGFSYIIAPEENEGFENAEFGVKFALIPDVFSASLAGTFGDAAYTINCIVTQGLGPLEFDGNIGFETSGIGGEKGVVIYALALIFDATPFALGVESAGDKDGLQIWLAGGRYTLHDGLAVDAGIAGNFKGDANLSATIGIHYEF